MSPGARRARRPFFDDRFVRRKFDFGRRQAGSGGEPEAAGSFRRFVLCRPAGYWRARVSDLQSTIATQPDSFMLLPFTVAEPE